MKKIFSNAFKYKMINLLIGCVELPALIVIVTAYYIYRLFANRKDTAN